MRPPGSKSLTNRAYILAALASGVSRVRAPLRAEDTDRLLAALCNLGAQASWDEDDVLITGVDGRFPRGGAVDLGDGGTPTRFMIAAACLANGVVTVDGSPRMRERPVAEGVELLRHLGASIEYLDAPGQLPLRVDGRHGLRGGAIEVRSTASSQFISALLLVAPFLADDLRLRYLEAVTSPTYIALTTGMLAEAGVRISGLPGRREPGAGDAQIVHAGPVAAHTFSIEPDASSAAYWFAAAAMGRGCRIAVPALAATSQQPDMAVPAALAAAGADGVGDDHGIAMTGPVRLAPIIVDCHRAPDGALALAAAAAKASGPSRLTGLATLRVKESDRIAALATELERVGCAVVATDDTLEIDPAGLHDQPAVIQTYNDHRMAMAFAVLGLHRPGISIADPGCVAKSYPGFWRDLLRLRV